MKAKFRLLQLHTYTKWDTWNDAAFDAMVIEPKCYFNRSGPFTSQAKGEDHDSVRGRNYTSEIAIVSSRGELYRGLLKIFTLSPC
jgi:hypothetical protein